MNLQCAKKKEKKTTTTNSKQKQSKKQNDKHSQSFFLGYCNTYYNNVFLGLLDAVFLDVWQKITNY